MDELQQRRAGCLRGSVRYRRLSEQIAKLQAGQARQRREAMHVWTTTVARRFGDVTVVAPASIKEVTASGHGDVRDHGAATALKAELNRHVLAQTPAMAVQMLSYKMAEAGGSCTVVEIENHKAVVGNVIVTATKANRKLKRAVKKCTRT